MKVFVTLATILGVSAATPLFHNQLHRSNDKSMGMSMRSQMSQHGTADSRHMEMNQMSGMRNMYRKNQEMTPNMMNRNMMGQDKSLNMKNMHMDNQAFEPNQYFLKDDMGNYVYSYDDQHTEKKEEGNNQSVKGRYTYVMSNGVKRKVEYIADNQGFHIIRDNADPARIKRSVGHDLIPTRMTSVMDSSSLRDDIHDMNRMSKMVGRDMSSNMDINLMGMNQYKYANLMGQNNMGLNLMGQDTMGHSQFGRNIMGQDTMGSNMMTQDVMGPKMMAQDVTGRNMNDRNMKGQDTMEHNMMEQNMYNILSDRGMKSDVSNMMGQERISNMGRNMMGHRDMTPNRLYSNMLGRDMDMSNNQMSSNMMNRLPSEMRGRMDSYSNDGLIGQRMMQKMEIERIPETYTSTRFY